MTKPQVIQAGYCVAVCLVPGTAPESCYTGLVEAADEYGVRIAMVHWDDKLDMIGGYTESLFVPWGNISSMLVSTEKQPTRRFMVDRAPKWVSKVKTMGGEEPARKKSAAKD